MPTADLGNLGRLFTSYEAEREALRKAEEEQNAKLETPGTVRPVSDLDAFADTMTPARYLMQGPQTPTLQSVEQRAAPPNIAGAQAQQAQPQNIAQPPQPQQSAFDRFREGAAAGFVGMSAPEMQNLKAQVAFNQAQAALKQFEIQQQMKVQAAEANYPSFIKKAPQFGKILDHTFKRQNEDRKSEGLEPLLRPNAGTVELASQKFDELYPSMALTPQDQLTMTLSERARAFMVEKNILPLETLSEVVKYEQNEQARQRASLMASDAQLPTPGTLFERQQHSLPPNIAGPVQADSYAPSEYLKTRAEAMGMDVNELAALVSGGTLNKGRQFNQPFEPPTINPNRRALLTEMQEAGKARSTALAQKAGDEVKAPMTGAEANAELRRQIAPLVNKPEDFTLFDDNAVVTQKQFEETAKEFNNNLRKATTVEGQNFRTQQKLDQTRQENDLNRSLQRELLETKNDNIKDIVGEKSTLAMTLQSRAQEHQIRRDQGKFTQEEKQDQFKADAAIERQRERLQTEAGIAFTRDAIRNSPDDAVKFALEAQRLGGATVRGVLGSLLKTNPGLAWPLIQRLGSGVKLAESTMESVKGAVSDYLGGLAEGGVQAEIDQVLDGAGTDQTKKLKLVGIKNKQKPGTKDRDLVQTYLDALEDKKSGITINNLPTPPEAGGGLDAVTRRRYITAIHENTTGVSSMNELLGIIEKTPVSGIAGLAQQVKNFFVGTAYDIDVIRENVDEEAFEKRFNPDVEAGVYMANLVQYAVARSNEPGGRLTDRDISRVNLGVSAIKSTPQLKAALLKARSEILSKTRQHSDLLKIGGLKFTPDPIDRDMIIENFAHDPQIAKMSEREAMDLIQLTLQEANGVVIGNVDAREMLREIRKRGKRQ